MSIYLLSGPSGIGKTSIGFELQKHGFVTIDTDKEFGYHGNLITHEPVEYPGDALHERWFQDNGWLWNEDKVNKQLETDSTDIFFVGGANNEKDFYPRFQKIFRLIANPDVLVERLLNRDDNYSSNPAYIARMLHILEITPVEHADTGAVIIDTTNQSVEESAQEILRQISR